MYVYTHVIPLPAKYTIKNLVREDCYAVVFCLQMRRFLNSGFTTLLEEVCCYRYNFSQVNFFMFHPLFFSFMMVQELGFWGRGRWLGF